MNLKLTNVFYKYRGTHKTVINGLSFELKSKKLGIIGASGSGKSTLIHLLNGMHIPIHGTIEIGDTIINNEAKPKNLQAIRKQVAIVYQFTDLQLFAETVKAELMFAAQNFKVDMSDIDEQIAYYFDLFNLDDDLLNESPFALSGGQKKKIAIISMLLIKPQMLILDEPTVGLDPQSVVDILTTIDKLTNTGLAVLLISHDMDVIKNFCDDILEIHGGMKIFDGRAANYFRLKYYRNQQLMLPTKLKYARQVDDIGCLYEDIYNGNSIEEYVKEKDNA